MRRKNIFVLIILSLLMITFTAACGGNTDSSGDKENMNNSSKENAINDSEATNGNEEWPSSMRMGTAAVGGLFYVYGGGTANVIEEFLDISVNVEQTGGPIDNIQLMERGDIEIGFATAGPMWEALHGEGDWTAGQNFEDARAIFSMYPSYAYMLARKDSGVESYHDLEGKTIGIGPAGGTPGTYWPQFLNALGIEPGQIINANWNDIITQQVDGGIDGQGHIGNVPVAALLETETQIEPSWLSFSDEDMDILLEEFHYLSSDVIPAGSYETQENDLLVPTMWAFAIVHKNLPDDLVYEIVDAVMNNNDMMQEGHVAAEFTTPENIEYNTFFPMHPGAIQWYEDNGYELPEEVYPES